ncbi:tetratricopeptide repeat-containing sensor histidine kinase [Mucilaginibacter terrae]|uniref:histidine kinase n=1 Tax=Mucilaginibacter terrae TaxID=1955052 RepID=A0ABU3H0R7_9SPHI|nr:tetratricopeptide repeat-containing sensor histidine kinase [Mucilaginibacter terrae]MDT3405618.1 signal transduction histidine kinase [Mucilaginibacter terrae]
MFNLNAVKSFTGSVVYACTLCLVVFAAPVFAQKQKVDSLENLLKKSMPDSARLRLLQQVTEAYSSVDPKKKFYYANIYKQLANKLGNHEAVADSYVNMGISYGIQSRLDSALYYFDVAYTESAKIKYQLGMGRSLACLAYAYDRLDDEQESIKYNIKALNVYKKIKYTRGINQCLVNIGSIYYEMKQYGLAESYFQQALKSYTAANDNAGVGSALYELGNCYQVTGQFTKALSHLNKSLEIREGVGDINGGSLSRKGLGRLYYRKKEYNEAIKHFNIAVNGFRTLHDKFEEATTHTMLADVYLATQDDAHAEEHALVALNLAQAAQSKIALSDALQKLVMVYKMRKQVDIAFDYQSRYVANLDSIRADNALKNVTLGEFNRIRLENAELTKDNHIIARQNTDYVARINNYGSVLIIVVVILALVVLLLFIQYKRNLEKQAANKLLTQQKYEIALINSELEAVNHELSAQMDLSHRQNVELGRLNDVKNKFFSIVSHDLRSPLSTLQSLFSIYHDGDIGEKELGEMLVKLEDTILTTGNFLDNLLEWSKSQFDGIKITPVNFNVADCINENICLYDTKIALKNLQVVNEVVQPVCIYADRNMISLVIRNLLSNSIKFCNPTNSITFSAEVHDERVLISITDTGRGMSEAEQDKVFNLDHTLTTGTQGEKGNHLGLILCRDMVMQNKGIIWFESKEGVGTTFWIDLPAAALEQQA